jgi:hypothetical protein
MDEPAKALCWTGGSDSENGQVAEGTPWAPPPCGPRRPAHPGLGRSNAEGDKEILSKLTATLAILTPDFEMVPGTKEQAPRQDLNPYEIGPLERCSTSGAARELRPLWEG